MDTLSDLLAPYSNEFAQIARTMMFFQYMSGIFFINNIRKKGSSDGFPAGPFLGPLVLTVLSMKFGVIINDDTMVKINFLGFTINAVFLAIYYFYASTRTRSQTRTQIGVAMLFIIGTFIYANYEQPTKIASRFGFLIRTVLVLLISAPLMKLNVIIKNKSTAGMPYPLIVTGSLVSTSWMLFNISTKNVAGMRYNLFLLSLASIPLTLYFIYPNKLPTKLNNSEKLSFEKSDKKVN